MLNEKIKLILIVLIAPFFLGGCDFLSPEDDINGNNGKVNPLNKIEVKEEYIKKTQTAGGKNEQIAQLEQSVNQAEYEMMKMEEAKKKENPPVSEPGEKTDIEKELLTYTDKYAKATIETNLGKIKISFYSQEAPLAVGNFIKLAESGFFEKIKFHRVISGFMIQAGDPNSKDENWEDDGQGGPGYAFRDEINNHKLVRGSLAMANSGKDTNGSQFFIVTAESTPHLDGKHTAFGEVTGGMDVVESIEKVRINEKDHPTQDVIIEKIELGE